MMKAVQRNSNTSITLPQIFFSQISERQTEKITEHYTNRPFIHRLLLFKLLNNGPYWYSKLESHDPHGQQHVGLCTNLLPPSSGVFTMFVVVFVLCAHAPMILR